MAGDITLKIDADTAQYIGKLSRMADETKHVAGHVKSIGGMLEHANGHLASHLVRTVAMGEAYRKILEEVEKIAAAAEDASKKLGSESLTRDKSYTTLGASQGLRNLVENGAGGATDDERTAALQTLARFHRESRVPMTDAMMRQYVAATNSGAYTPEDLTMRMSRGMGLPGASDIDAALAAMSPGSRNELATRAQERANERAGRAAQAQLGGTYREWESQQHLREAEHPWLTTVSDNTISRPVNRAIETNRAANAYAWALGPEYQILRVIARSLEHVDGNTQHKKTLNLSGQSEGAK